jgi:hypothetical protein
MISKNPKKKTMNYLIILIKFKVSRFLCRSVYIYREPINIFEELNDQIHEYA